MKNHLWNKCEVVNPSLKKPGLRIFGPNSPEVYAFRLFEEGKLKKEDLKRFGFIVFEKHLPSHDIPRQYSFTPKNDMQFLHRDGYYYRSSNLSTHQSLMLEHGVIGFQTYSSLPIRKSYTAIMDRQHAMHDISLFALWNEKEEISHYSEANSILEELRDGMRKVGIAHIDLKKYPRTIRSFTRLPQQKVVGLNRFWQNVAVYIFIPTNYHNLSYWTMWIWYMEYLKQQNFRKMPLSHLFLLCNFIGTNKEN